MEFYRILEKASGKGRDLSVPEIAVLLNAPDEAAEKALFAAAYELKKQECGQVVNLRGLIEFSNICTRDCYYCGIRKSNLKPCRYTMSMDEIVQAASIAGEYGYGSVVLQSGERSDGAFADFVEEAVKKISALPYDLGITLSCGEESLETYQRWRRAGARRYLLRIESSSERIFSSIHPAESSFFERKAALKRLQEADFQTGSGVMIGLPGQSVEDLAKDVDFFREMDLDMIGMGPYIPQEDTPLGVQFPGSAESRERSLLMTLRMIAVTRLVLRDVNIAATTALQALDPLSGRERGILAGANVIMPNVGDVSRRQDYQLYNGKPSLDENSAVIRQKLTDSLAAIGEKPRFGGAGDPLHYFRRKKR